MLLKMVAKKYQESDGTTFERLEQCLSVLDQNALPVDRNRLLLCEDEDAAVALINFIGRGRSRGTH